MARGERKAIIPPLPTFTTKESRRFERYATSTEQEVPIRLSYSKPRQEVLNEDTRPPALFPIFTYNERFKRRFYGFNEALKQDIPRRNTVSGEQYGP